MNPPKTSHSPKLVTPTTSQDPPRSRPPRKPPESPTQECPPGGIGSAATAHTRDAGEGVFVGRGGGHVDSVVRAYETNTGVGLEGQKKEKKGASSFYCTYLVQVTNSYTELVTVHTCTGN